MVDLVLPLARLISIALKVEDGGHSPRGSMMECGKSSSSCTTAVWPPLAASMSMVELSLSLRKGSASHASRNFTTSTWPPAHASDSGVWSPFAKQESYSVEDVGHSPRGSMMECGNSEQQLTTAVWPPLAASMKQRVELSLSKCVKGRPRTPAGTSPIHVAARAFAISTAACGRRSPSCGLHLPRGCISAICTLNQVWRRSKSCIREDIQSVRHHH
ncbi:hypothetical protein ACJJTC_014780 [Scirpophaga incertulas]